MIVKKGRTHRGPDFGSDKIPSGHARRVLITGGTGSVGVALCKAFARIGDSVTFLYRSQTQKARYLRKECGAEGNQMDFYKSTTLTNRNFDVLINNAAINETDCLVHDLRIDDWNKALLINLTVPFILAKQCLPWMIKKKWGRIINISSIYGLRAVAGRLPYTASKHGLSGLTKTIAREYAPYGVTCNEICPGPIESEMMDRVARAGAKKYRQSVQEYFTEVREGIPTGRMLVPEEVAELAVFLASSKAASLNGSSIPLDGAMIV
jgi:3-hydroxybutyrate dehydrogenase